MPLSAPALPGSALPPLDAASRAELAAVLRQFARQDCTQEPLYAALCEVAAQDEQALALLAQAPPAQRKANLLLAALHERVLAGEGGPLAAYYRSAGGERQPDAGLAAALSSCLAQQGAVLVGHLRHRATQTNEIARCAALWPALGDVARLTGASALALLDYGCSAGLNLGVDAYALRYQPPEGPWQSRGPAPDGRRAEIECLWLGPQPLPPEAAWQVVRRDGIDPAPVDVADPAQLRWLQACLWPADARRRERLARAAQQQRSLPVRLTAAADCTAALESWVCGLPGGVQPVLLTSWVLYYLSAAELDHLRATVDQLAQRHGLVWVCGELPALSAPGLAASPLPELPAGESGASATWWTLRRAVQGGIAVQGLGWSHPHGRWVAWG